MALVRWSPLRDVLGVRDEMDRLLDEFYGRTVSSGEKFEGDWTPVMDISDSNGDIVASMELPGLKTDDIKVSVEDDVLTVTGEKKQQESQSGDNWRRVERTYGYFKRSVKLPAPVDADKVKAAYKDGVLTISMPKIESKKAKEIPIHVS